MNICDISNNLKLDNDLKRYLIFANNWYDTDIYIPKTYLCLGLFLHYIKAILWDKDLNVCKTWLL